jgi:hypothetical protein
MRPLPRPGRAEPRSGSTPADADRAPAPGIPAASPPPPACAPARRARRAPPPPAAPPQHRNLERARTATGTEDDARAQCVLRRGRAHGNAGPLWPFPVLRTACTLKAARRAWPELRRHGLADVSSHLAVQFRHHHASEDAEASATIGLRVSEALGLGDVANLHEELLKPHGTRSVRGAAPSPVALPCPLRPAPRANPDPRQPLHGRTVVPTGVLRSMTREEVLEAVAAAGGRTAAAVSANVDYVVAGAAPGPAKLRRARELVASGCRVEIVDERRFLELLDKHSARAPHCPTGRAASPSQPCGSGFRFHVGEGTPAEEGSPPSRR